MPRRPTGTARSGATEPIRGAGRPPLLCRARTLGSRARIDIPADEWSDTDLLVFTTDASRWLGDGRWLDDIGRVVLTFVEPTALAGLLERRVLFDGAVDVDMVIIPIDAIENVISDAGAIPVLARGYRLLVDKDDRFGDLAGRAAAADARAIHGAAPWPPTAEEVSNLIRDYLYHCVWVTKKLRRGELAVAVSCQNAYQGATIRRFVEWQAGARSNVATNTYYDGRFLERWADPETVTGLTVTQAAYDVDDLGRSIVESMELFRGLASEVADAVRVAYPGEAHAWIRNWVRGTLSEAQSR